ncbi:MAG: hypothetical protein Q8O40_09720 [Chloroflexota bacterium]|nr:hypothetical protein [Chloroflexota bacterium]
MVVPKHPNVYADTSALFYRPWTFNNAIRLAYESRVTNTPSLGSDWPVTDSMENTSALAASTPSLASTTSAK